MEYEDTNILRTQYVDDLVKQRQALEDAMLYQEAPVTAGEGLNTMVPKVKSLTGSKSDIPYVNFYNINVTTDTINSLNVYGWDTFAYMFATESTSTKNSIDLRGWYLDKPKNMEYMFYKRWGSIYTNEYFNCEYVENASHLLGATGSYGGYSVYIYNDREWNFKNLINADAMFGNVNNWNFKNPIKITSKNLKTMVDTFDHLVLTSNDLPDSHGFVVLFKSLYTSNITSIKSCFSSSMIAKPVIDLICSKDWSSLTDMESAFYETYYYPNGGTADFSAMYLPKLTNIKGAFQQAKYVKKLVAPTIPNETLKKLDSCFYIYNNSTFTELDLSHINMGGINNVSYVDFCCPYITDFYFGYNLGKGYTSKTNNYSNYKLDLSYMKVLTRDSVLNVFNRLYDLNITYDTANTGKIYTQQIKMHADTKALLTAEDVAIVTNKGWTIV